MGIPFGSCYKNIDTGQIAMDRFHKFGFPDSGSAFYYEKLVLPFGKSGKGFVYKGKLLAATDQFYICQLVDGSLGKHIFLDGA